jgi:hypothetical protein
VAGLAWSADIKSRLRNRSGRHDPQSPQLRFAENPRTSLSHARVGRRRSRHCGPPAFLDKCAPVPIVVDLVQLGEICLCVRGLTELVDADRCQRGNDRRVRSRFRDPFNGASQRPSTPVEANDHRHGGAGSRALQETRE